MDFLKSVKESCVDVFNIVQEDLKEFTDTIKSDTISYLHSQTGSKRDDKAGDFVTSDKFSSDCVNGGVDDTTSGNVMTQETISAEIDRLRKLELESEEDLCWNDEIISTEDTNHSRVEE